MSTALGLVDRLGTGLDGRCLGQLEHAQHFHRPVTGLGCRADPAAEHRPGGGLGVEGVGLAPATASGLVRLVDLDHLNPGRPQVPGQCCTVGAGALHASPPQHPQRVHPGQQRSVTGRGSGEPLAAQQHTQRVDHRCGVQILMGIHTENYLASGVVVLVVVNRLGHAGHGSSLS
jgi:hypothetical protein